MNSLQIAKKALRSELKQKLKNMTAENRSYQSKIIFEKLLKNTLYKNSQRISVYLNRDIEVETEAIVLDILACNKQCFIPKYDSKSTQMDMVLLKSFDEYKNLPLTSWNIKQPHDSDVTDEDAFSTGGLDLIIVPGIGFTKNGDRIGNGKGYYDIYLKKCQEILGKKIPTIALAFKEQIVTSIPTSEDDIPIDEVIYSNDAL